MSAPAFKITEKQVQDLIAMTPAGYSPRITLSFERENTKTAEGKDVTDFDKADLKL